MSEFEERQAYQAGRLGQAQPNLQTEAFQAGQQGREYRLKPRQGNQVSGEGAGMGILGIFLIVLLLAFIAFVVTALGAALIIAPLLMLAVKLTDPRSSATYREAFNMMAGILVVSLILIAAVLAPSVYFAWDKVAMSGIATIDLGLRALRSLGLETEHMQMFSASFPGIRQPQFVSKMALLATAFLAPLVLFSAIAMKSTLKQVFPGVSGFLRALVIAPFILVAGLIAALGIAVVLLWLLDRWF